MALVALTGTALASHAAGRATTNSRRPWQGQKSASGGSERWTRLPTALQRCKGKLIRHSEHYHMLLFTTPDALQMATTAAAMAQLGEHVHRENIIPKTIINVASVRTRAMRHVPNPCVLDKELGDHLRTADAYWHIEPADTGKNTPRLLSRRLKHIRHFSGRLKHMSSTLACIAL